MNTQLTELNAEQRADLHRLAQALKAVSDTNAVIKNLNAKYADFLLQYEDDLKDGVTIGDLRLTVKYSRKLIAEEI